VVTPGTDFSKLYLLAVREAAGGFAGTVGYMVKPCITVIVYGRICACLYHRGEALALKHGAGGCGSAFPSSLGGNRLGRAGRWLGRRASGRQHRAESSSAVLPVEIECKARAHVAKTPIIIDDYPTLGDGEPQTRLQREEMR
jgi:hypothetical protein